MSPPTAEVHSFLRRSQVAQVASLSPKGRPFSTPLWFVVDGGAIYLATGWSSRVVRNLAQKPAVVMLFRGELERRAGRCLRLRGTASIHRGFPPWPVLMRIAIKYYLRPPGLLSELRHVNLWGLRQRYYAQNEGGPGYLRVVTSSADFLSL